MQVVGKDCRETGEILHKDLSKEERRIIEAARTRAGEIADIWLDFHFFGVKWNQDQFGYLMRVAGEDWFTAHFVGDAPWEELDNGSRFPAFSRKLFRSQLRDFILHATRKTKPKWRYRGNPIVGLGFPIHDNKRQRRVLSIDVDYAAIKQVKHNWPAGIPEPDWRDPLAKPNLLLMDPAFGLDVEGRGQDAELLRNLGALVVPGETGFQAHFYLTDHQRRKVLRPVVEAIASLMHGKIDVTNVGTYQGNGEWNHGLPSSLPLPMDRRHLAAFVIDPLIDEFYDGDFEIPLGDLVQRVEARLDENRRLSPPSSTGGGSSLAALDASPSAPVPAAPTIKGTGCRLAVYEPEPQAEQEEGNKGCSGYNGIQTPDQAEPDAYAEVANLSIRQSMSRHFLERLDAVQAGTAKQPVVVRRRARHVGGFPYELLDERGLIWSHIPSIDPLLVVPTDVSLGTIPEGKTNDWINMGLAHFHSREEFERAIAGQGDEKRKLARYDWAARHGVQAVHQAAILPSIADAFFEEVWHAVLSADPVDEDDNATNVARAIEKRRKRFVIACHGLISSRCSHDGIVVLPVRGSADLLVDGGVNLVAFGREVVAPIKQAFFGEVCMAWIKGWKRQQNRVPVLAPNEAGEVLRELLPLPTRRTYLEYDPCDLKRDAYFYDHSYREALAADQSHQAMAIWLRPTLIVRGAA